MRIISKLALLSFLFIQMTSLTWGEVKNGINYEIYAFNTPITDLESVPYTQLNPFTAGVCSQVNLDELNTDSWPSATGYIVRFKGWYRFARGNNTTFSVTADSMTRLMVGSGSALTVEIDQVQSSTTQSGTFYLPGGYQPIIVEYYTEDTSTADLEIVSQVDGRNGRELLPSKLFFQDPSSNLVPGIYYETFVGNYDGISLTDLDFNAMVPAETGLSNSFDFNYQRDDANSFIIWSSGLIEIPQAGEWTFYLSSGDASLIYINGSANPLIYNAGTGYQYGSNTIQLDAGLNEIEVVCYTNDGMPALSLDYSSVGFPVQTVPATSLFVLPPIVTPGIYYEVHDISLTQIEGANFRELRPIAMNNGADISTNVPTNLDTNANSDFALKFVGWIYLPETGMWHFRLTSDDGSALFLDDSEDSFILNDNTHGTVASKTLGTHLTRGFHRIEVHYFKNHSDGIDSSTLSLEYRGPWEGSVMEPIKSALYTTDYIIGDNAIEQLLPYTVFY